ncbi:GIP, partial [Symbiodinium sp. CCMP2456]
ATSSGTPITTGERTGPGEIDDFLKNATQILKMMADKQSGPNTPGPSMKMLKKAVRRFENRMALVDSGATHPLREAKPEEWPGAPEVDVVIAGDGVTTMRQNQEVLKMTSGCPEVNEALALQLIARIEQEKLAQLEKATEESKQILVRAMKVQKDPEWEKSLRRFVTSGKFEDGYCAISSMPWATEVMNEDLVKTISDIPQSEKEAWDLMMTLGFNRRMRKRMMHKDWVIRFFSGRRSPIDKMFKSFENNGTMVLDVDVLRWTQLDMLDTNKGIMTLMLWGAATGRVAGTFTSVPRNNSFEHALRVVVINEVARMGRQIMCESMDVPNDDVAMCIWASSQSQEGLWDIH